MNILLWIILGALAGWIASIAMGTNENQGIFMDVLLGILGAFVGGLIMSLFGQPGVTGFNAYSIVVAILGAVILVSLKRAIQRRAY